MEKALGTFAVCLTKADRNTIFFGGCLLWVHKKCGIKGPLAQAPDAWAMYGHIDGKPMREILVGNHQSSAFSETTGWLLSQAANVRKLSYYNFFSPTATCHC